MREQFFCRQVVRLAPVEDRLGDVGEHEEEGDKDPLSAAAAVTKRLKLGTAICLVIQRDTIQTAKLVA